MKALSCQVPKARAILHELDDLSAKEQGGTIVKIKGEITEKQIGRRRVRRVLIRL